MDILTMLLLTLFIFGMAKWCDEGETQVGDWGDVYGYFLTDVVSGTAGKLVAAEDFSDGPYTVNDDWSVKVTPQVTIS